jgi:hypothetical protein
MKTDYWICNSIIYQLARGSEEAGKWILWRQLTGNKVAYPLKARARTGVLKLFSNSLKQLINYKFCNVEMKT